MLDFMRKKSNSGVILVIFGIVILSFVLAGNWGGMGGGSGQVVANVNGVKITNAEVTDRLNQEIERYKGIFKENFKPEMIETLNLRNIAVQSLVEKVLILGYAEDNDIKITDKELQDHFRGLSYFQKDGVFDKETYYRVLKENNLNMSTYEKYTRDMLLLQKASTEATSGVIVSEEDAKNLYVAENRKLKFDYARFELLDYLSKVKVSEDEGRKYLSENAALFMVPRKVKAFYAYTNKFDLADSVTVSAQDVRAYYEANKMEFATEEEVKVRHILIRPANMKDEALKAEAKTKIESILAEVNSGGDFAALAKEYTQDPGSRDSGGFYDYFKRGVMVKPFENTAFGLNIGEVSGVVETQYGYHIIKSEGKRGGEDSSLEAVSKEVETRLKQDLVERKSRDLINTIEGAFKGAQTAEELKTVTNVDGISTRETGFFTSGDMAEELGRVKNLNNGTFSLGAGGTTTVIDTPSGSYIIRLLESVDAHIADYNDVKGEIAGSMKESKAMDMAAEDARLVLDGVRMGLKSTFKNYVKGKGFKFGTTDYIKETDGMIEKLGLKLTGNKMAFAVTKENPLVNDMLLGEKGAFVFYFNSIIEPSMADYELEKAMYRKRLQDDKTEEAYKEWVKGLKGNAVIKMYQG